MVRSSSRKRGVLSRRPPRRLGYLVGVLPFAAAAEPIWSLPDRGLTYYDTIIYADPVIYNTLERTIIDVSEASISERETDMNTRRRRNGRLMPPSQHAFGLGLGVDLSSPASPSSSSSALSSSLSSPFSSSPAGAVVILDVTTLRLLQASTVYDEHLDRQAAARRGGGGVGGGNGDGDVDWVYSSHHDMMVEVGRLRQQLQAQVAWVCRHDLLHSSTSQS